MATMNISLPDVMKDWAEQRTRSGKYGNTSDYVRDLIRRDQERVAQIEQVQKLIDEGLENGIEDGFSMDAVQDAFDRA